ncbi:adenylate/guanylate cyclase domain-containing protein [Azospirillum canadense]|uniref:adenylate/guanylate cyclase domain-containing protein n=1 Tax=Azospirillum canadense TaxID=403962 RepID=UPI0022274B69|nr:adenylate/guanylate cyclase domain-containing protein [Azospirillum canadense]MCW2239283.1 class 3 adenylate cyclase [Azospirillum canadense]
MKFDLFESEEAVIARARAFVETDGFGNEAARAAFAELLKSYEHLFKITRRLIRLSDRNEAELNAMAEKQRRSVEKIAQKNKQLEAVSKKLSKYLSPQVYNSIFIGAQEVKLESQRKKLTIFFSDIANFTEATDKMESEDLTNLLNHYLTEMSSVALEYGATIDKYVGDTIMIFFGDPETRGIKDDALACVKMAIAMQKRMRELAGIWHASGVEAPPRCRIGIHTGYCTVGNFGSEDRMDYTIIGGPVNIASRLEHEAPVGSILISYETYAHVNDQVYCEEHGQIHVKGVAYPVVTYEAIDLLENLTSNNRPLSANLPHLQLELDPRRMSTEEQREARRFLLEALSRLSPAGQARGSNTAE